ncbi:hypothetical protein [Phenylobacterium sp.]|uniref:hypothetical protein n=1 Tax=Phenylobacterium sp. TaxID=1871053 RepID=UPI00286BD0AE|nr:hypothetical protein [Phenylobacterium sp.]
MMSDTLEMATSACAALAGSVAEVSAQLVALAGEHPIIAFQLLSAASIVMLMRSGSRI